MAVLTFAGLWTLRQTGALQGLELGAYDLVVRLGAAAPELDPRIVLVAATEADVQRWGWPLSDVTLAELLERLATQRPRAIGLDLYRDAPRPPGSERFAALLATRPEIIGITKFPGRAHPGVGAPPALVGSERVGFVDVLPDSDGIVRRALLFVDDGETLAYAFALRLALTYLAEEGIHPAPAPGEPAHLRLGPTNLAPIESHDGGYSGADARGYQILIDYLDGPALFPSYSVTDALTGAIPQGALHGRIVIVGVSAESVQDLFHTPLTGAAETGPYVTGIALHGDITAQLLDAALAGAAPIAVWSEGGEAMWLGLWAGLGTLAGLWLRAAWRFLAVATMGLAALGLIAYVALLQRWWLPLVPPALGWLAATALSTAYVGGLERAQRALVMGLFTHFVPREVAETLWAQRERFVDGGHLRSQRLTCTILFSDLRGYTTIAEGMEPQVLIDWLDTYMAEMARLVVAHGGGMNQFIGDAVMAVFGAPVARTGETEICRDAVRAVECALGMEAALQGLNAAWEAQGLPTTGMRVGILTGPVVTGTLGNSERLEYAVVGDTVNTAARLESLDKTFASPASQEWACRILVGEATLRRLGGRYLTRCVGTIALKGKRERIAVHQVLGRIEDEGNVDS